MKLKFETFFRWYVIALVALLVWSVWASAGAVAPTNAAPAVPLLKLSATNTTLAREWLTFGLDDVEFLQESLFGKPRWQYCASLIYVFLAVFAARFIDLFVCGLLKKWAARTQTEVDNGVLKLIRGPVKVVSFVILLHIGLNIFAWPPWVDSYLSKCLHIVVAFSLTWLLLDCVDIALSHWRERATAETDKHFDEMLVPVISKGVKVFVVIVAVLATAQNLGLNVTGVLASLSIGGLALGLAAQDTLANLFGAVAVFVDRPFRIGDRIQLDKVDGMVETIGLRSTRVRNLDGHLITVPNKTMGNATITNITRRPNIKTELNLGITYGTPPEKVRRALAILTEVFRAHPMTHDLIVSFNKFADSSLNLYVCHWWNSTDQRAYLAGMQELNLTIKQRFDAEGIEFAFSPQTPLMRQVGK